MGRCIRGRCKTCPYYYSASFDSGANNYIRVSSAAIKKWNPLCEGRSIQSDRSTYTLKNSAVHKHVPMANYFHKKRGAAKFNHPFERVDARVWVKFKNASPFLGNAS